MPRAPHILPIDDDASRNGPALAESRPGDLRELEKAGRRPRLARFTQRATLQPRGLHPT